MTTVTCGICFQEAKQPKKLQICKHTFCRVCILHSFEQMTQENNYKCPSPKCIDPLSEEDIIILKHYAEQQEMKIHKFDEEQPQKISAAQIEQQEEPGITNTGVIKPIEDKDDDVGSAEIVAVKVAVTVEAVDQNKNEEAPAPKIVKIVQIQEVCPKCKTWTNNNATGHKMTCTVCGHNWCQTCGVAMDSCFHYFPVSIGKALRIGDEYSLCNQIHYFFEGEGRPKYKFCYVFYVILVFLTLTTWPFILFAFLSSFGVMIVTGLIMCPKPKPGEKKEEGLGGLAPCCYLGFLAVMYPICVIPNTLLLLYNLQYTISFLVLLTYHKCGLKPPVPVKSVGRPQPDIKENLIENLDEERKSDLTNENPQDREGIQVEIADIDQTPKIQQDNVKIDEPSSATTTKNSQNKVQQE